MNAADTAVLWVPEPCQPLETGMNGRPKRVGNGKTLEALKKLESWKTWSRGAAVTAEGQLQCSFFMIFSACSASPRDIAVPDAWGETRCRSSCKSLGAR